MNMKIWRHLLRSCKWLLLFLSVQALGYPSFSYIKIVDSEASRQSGLSKHYLEMVDKYAVEFSVTRLPKDFAKFPDENIFLHLKTRTHHDLQICRFNAGTCDEAHGGKQCYCKNVKGHEYHFIAKNTARFEDVGLFLVASWQNNQQTSLVTSDKVLVPTILKYPEVDIFYSSTVMERSSAILVCDLKRATYKSPPTSNVTVFGLIVWKRGLKDMFFTPLADYKYKSDGPHGRGSAEQKDIHEHINASNGRIVATLEGMCPYGCDRHGLNEDSMRIVIVFNPVTCDDAGEYTCRADYLQTQGMKVTDTTSELTVVPVKIEEIVGFVVPNRTAYQEDESVNFLCQTQGPSSVRIDWKYKICPTDSQLNPPIKDWYRASDIVHNNQRTTMSGGCNKSEIISKLKNVHLIINDQRICLIWCEAIFNGDFKKWYKRIKYTNPDFSESLTSIGTTTLTPQKTKRTFNNQGRNKRCNTFKYGPKCEHLCNDNCAKEGLCDEDTGVCHDGCKPGFNPPGCEKRCEKGTYSVNCSKSCVNCAKNYTTGEHLCEHSTGDCYFGCDKGYGGDKCEKLIVLSQLYEFITAKNITFLCLFTLLIVLLARSLLAKGSTASTVESDKVDPIQRIKSFGTEDSETSTGFESTSTMESDITDELGSSVDESITSDMPELQRPMMTPRRLCPIHGKKYSGPQKSVPSSVSWAMSLDSSTELSSVTTSNGPNDSSTISKWSQGIYKHH